MKPSAHVLMAAAARFAVAPTQEVRHAHLVEISAEIREVAWQELLRRCPGYRLLEEQKVRA